MLASNKNQIQFNECYKQVHLGLNVQHLFFTENYWDGAAEKFAWKMKTWGGGGSRESCKIFRGHHFSEVIFKEGIG